MHFESFRRTKVHVRIFGFDSKCRRRIERNHCWKGKSELSSFYSWQRNRLERGQRSVVFENESSSSFMAFPPFPFFYTNIYILDRARKAEREPFAREKGLIKRSNGSGWKALNSCFFETRDYGRWKISPTLRRKTLFVIFVLFWFQMTGKRSRSFKCAVHHRDREVCSENDFHILIHEPPFFRR